MSARNIDEAILRGLCIGPANTIRERLTDEIRDYVAHELMILAFENPRVTGLELFKRIFGEEPKEFVKPRE